MRPIVCLILLASFLTCRVLDAAEADVATAQWSSAKARQRVLVNQATGQRPKVSAPKEVDKPKADAKKSAPNDVLSPIQDVPGLPRVLLIGDSISMGYTLPVRKLLEGQANVHRITADEWYAQKPAFVSGLETRGERFVLEIPQNFAMWLHDPQLSGAPAKPVATLLRHSKALLTQPWQAYHVKDTHKGPMVWEVKSVACWLPRGDGVVGPYWLIVARNVLNPDEQKFFLSNASAGVPLAVLVHVAFSRWSVERCLQDEKSELGLSHFETRGYPAIQRHLLITQVSHLFLARETQRLRGEKSGGDLASSSRRDQRADRKPAAASTRSSLLAATHRRHIDSLATSQPTSSNQSSETSPPRTRIRRHLTPSNPAMPPRMRSKSAL